MGSRRREWQEWGLHGSVIGLLCGSYLGVLVRLLTKGIGTFLTLLSALEMFSPIDFCLVLFLVLSCLVVISWRPALFEEEIEGK